jgi:phosphoribosylformylglycinamidine synthase
MPQLIRLRGRSALSAFRLQKLLQAVSDPLPGVRIDAEYWHFVQVAEALSDGERGRL